MVDINGLFPEIPANDLSLKWINTVAGFDNTMLADIFFIVNSMLSSIGAAYFIYIVIIGVANSAHSGEALGRWSTLWVPARLIFAVALLVPLPATGLNTVQYIYYGTARLGISAANYLWETSVRKLTQNLTPIAVTRPPSVEAFAKSYFLNLHCQYSANRIAATLGYNDGFVIQRTVSTEVESKIVFDGVKTRGVGPAVCGTVSISRENSELREVEAKLIGSEVKIPEMAIQVTNAKMQLLNRLTTEIMPLVQKMSNATINGAEMPTLSEARRMDDALRDYQNNAALYIKDYVNYYKQESKTNPHTIMDDAYGEAARSWVFAGLWWLRLSDTNGVINRAIQAVPTTSPPTYSGLGRDTIGTLSRAQSQAEIWWDHNLSLVGRAEAQDRAYTVGASQNILSQFGLRDGMMRWLVIDSAENPLGDLVSFGHGLVRAFWVGVAGLLAVAVPAGMVDGSTASVAGLVAAQFGTSALAKGVLAGLSTAGPVIWLVLLAMLGPGVTLAYVLPFKIVMVWTYSLAVYLLRFFAAMLAAPFWAIAHMSPGGDHLISERAASTYGTLIETLLRPIFMVISLIISLAIISLIADFTVKGLKLSFVSTMAGHSDMFTGALVMLVLTTILLTGMVSIVIRYCMSLPEMCVQALGFNGSGDSDKIDRATGESGGAMAQAAGTIQGAIRDAATSMHRAVKAQTEADRAKDLKESRRRAHGKADF
jgi:conjugal transfer/type IV secretion protein DotA/TraY